MCSAGRPLIECPNGPLYRPGGKCPSIVVSLSNSPRLSSSRAIKHACFVLEEKPGGSAPFRNLHSIITVYSSVMNPRPFVTHVGDALVENVE